MTDLIQQMTTCRDCRTLATDYGAYLIDSRRPTARQSDWELSLTTTRIRLEDHLAAGHPEWLPERRLDCAECDAWREDAPTGPIMMLEAVHRAWHLCEALRDVCTPGNHRIADLMS